jgi:hypothetical protein
MSVSRRDAVGKGATLTERHVVMVNQEKVKEAIKLPLFFIVCKLA